MNDDLALFEIPEPHQYDPTPRTTSVKAHTRAIRPRARRTDPETSVQAAESITPGRMEERIVPVLEAHGPQTASEITDRIPGAYLPTVVSALSRLNGSGTIEDTGRTRLSNRGRPSTVWSLR